MSNQNSNMQMMILLGFVGAALYVYSRKDEIDFIYKYRGGIPVNPPHNIKMEKRIQAHDFGNAMNAALKKDNLYFYNKYYDNYNANTMSSVASVLGSVSN